MTRSHRAVAHVVLAAAAMLVALLLSLQGAAAGPTVEKTSPISILPESIGVGVPTTDPVTVTFPAPMDRDSVADALVLRPSTAWSASWSEDGRTLSLQPDSRWMTDARYVVRIGSSARRADGWPMDAGRQLTFTTETAPVISDFQLHYPEESVADRVRAEVEADVEQASGMLPAEGAPSDTAAGVSAQTRITIGFSTLMDRSDVNHRFSIRPYVPGSLAWEGNALVFEPKQRLEPGTRYAVSLAGARDARGNRIAGDTSFSFTTRTGAQVVKVTPAGGAKDVTGNTAQLWFSQPMDTAATSAAFTLTDTTAEDDVAGDISWNAAGTQLTFTAGAALGRGHSFRISLDGAMDLDRNAVNGSWSFSSKAPPPAPKPVVTAAPSRPAGPPAPADIQQFALWQINQSRAAYGFAPLVLDAAIGSVANAHAWDMLNYSYFSHTGRDGSKVADRLRRAGISFSHAGENLCYHAGIGLRATMEWCHSVFMAEPYPGYFNHKANILNPRFTRVGIGIAQSGGKIYVVWNFAG